jgi:hypothetical protein
LAHRLSPVTVIVLRAVLRAWAVLSVTLTVIVRAVLVPPVVGSSEVELYWTLRRTAW